MMQRRLLPVVCEICGNEYWETGYWRDGELCPACSLSEKRQEGERKKELARRAAEAAEKYGLDLNMWPDELPEEVRRELNPLNAGRKSVKWENAYCELIIERANEGKSEAEFAVEIGVSQGLIQYWTEKHPNFKRAREIANDSRSAWIERYFRDAALGKVPCQPSMMNRLAAAKLGWGEKMETTTNTGEIPVVRLPSVDAGFPAETLEPSKEKIAEAGLAEALPA
jgi:ribosomal protein S9